MLSKTLVCPKQLLTSYDHDGVFCDSRKFAIGAGDAYFLFISDLKLSVTDFLKRRRKKGVIGGKSKSVGEVIGYEIAQNQSFF